MSVPLYDSWASVIYEKDVINNQGNKIKEKGNKRQELIISIKETYLFGQR